MFLVFVPAVEASKLGRDTIIPQGEILGVGGVCHIHTVSYISGSHSLNIGLLTPKTKYVILDTWVNSPIKSDFEYVNPKYEKLAIFDTKNSDRRGHKCGSHSLNIGHFAPKEKYVMIKT